MSDDKAVDDARSIVVECERGIKQIKAALRQLPKPNEASADKEAEPNSLEVEWVGLDKGDLAEENGALDVFLQLSSPIEDAVLKNMTSTTDGDEGAHQQGAAAAVFNKMETSVATLTVSLRKDGESLGSSEAYDMAEICKLDDVLNPKPSYVVELPVSIRIVNRQAPEEPAVVVAEQESQLDKATPEDDDQDHTEGKEAGKDEQTTGEGQLEEPPHDQTASKQDVDELEQDTTAAVGQGSTITTQDEFCTLTLRLTYKPSTKDQQDALFEQLSKTGERKSEALKTLRQLAVSGTKKSSTTSLATTTSKKSPAVKAGFLNKKAPQDEKPFYVQWYESTIGPESLGRAIFLISKNYVIFFGAMALFHFKGQELALPAPV